MKKRICLILCLALIAGAFLPAYAASFTDRHGNEIELDEALEAYTDFTLTGAEDAARKGETNLGDLWTDALRWLAVSGKINEYFEEDDLALGNDHVASDAEHIVSLWNGGNLRGDLSAGLFKAEDLASVLPYPNKVAVVYLTGAQLAEALEAASFGLPYTPEKRDACASLMQASGLSYTVNASAGYDKGEPYGDHWYRANSVRRVTIQEVNGKDFDPAATYAVITNNANFNGMDSSYIFQEAAEADARCAITTLDVREAIWAYLSEALDGHVGSAYEKPQGRITIEGGGFSDVAAGDWFTDSVYAAAGRGLLLGTSEGRFSPLAGVTRAQMLAVLYRMAGEPNVEAASGAWYAAPLAWAKGAGVSDGSDPEGAITREQLAAMLYRAAGSAPEDADLSAFSDAEAVSSWALPAVRWAVSKGILTGSNGALRPGAGASRAELAAMLVRYLGQ